MLEPHRFHVALNVRDLPRAVEFYRQILGRTPDKLHPGYARFLLDEPAVVLSLNAVGRVEAGNRVAHFGIRLGSAEALTRARERVLAAGHALREEHQTLCCHALSNKFWVVDPDGNEWEFYEVTDDHPEQRPPEPAAPAKSCC